METAREQIERVLIRYTTAMDERNWGLLDDVFVRDAIADYRGIGRFEGLTAIKEVVRGFLDKCGPTQHLLGNLRTDLDDQRATAQCYLQAVHAGRGDFAGRTMTVWGEYRDRLALRDEGWRIVHRELVVSHVDGDIGVVLHGAS